MPSSLEGTISEKCPGQLPTIGRDPQENRLSRLQRAASEQQQRATCQVSTAEGGQVEM